MAEIQENAIEWYSGDDRVCVTFTQKKFVNKVLRYAKTHEEIEIVADNEDGALCAHIPLSWIKISPPKKGREFTEEEKLAAAERLKEGRKKRNETVNG